MLGIYQIKNTVNGKIYIGSSVDIKRRWGDHKSRLRHHRHKNEHLQRAWDKYGEDSFAFELIYTVENQDELVPHEQWCIDVMFPEYNSRDHAGGNYTQTRLANLFNVSISVIHLVVRGKAWKHVGGIEDLTGKEWGRGRSLKIAFSDAEEIRELYKTGNYSQRKLGKLFKISGAYVWKIVKNKCRRINYDDAF